MVELNSSYSGLNTPIIDGYLRSVDELRKAVENALLPVISYFVARSQTEPAVVAIPSKLFEDQRTYLERIARRYFKRTFDFRIMHEDNDRTYDAVALLIRHARKSHQYSALDLCDLMLCEPTIFDNVNLPPNLARGVLEEIAEYNHIMPPKLAQVGGFNVSPSNPISHHQDTSPSTAIAPAQFIDERMSSVVKNKWPDAFSLYANVLSNVKKAIDFEALKLYDFLLENPRERVYSNKLLGIIHPIAALAEQEYAKIPHQVIVLPRNPTDARGPWNPWIDEWAANILRAFEYKQLMAINLREYLSQDNAQEQRYLIKKGCYPELAALIGETPD